MRSDRRQAQTEVLEQSEFDAVVVGAGINGAAVFRELVQAGLKVLLIDKGDFAGGTSQSSSMLIWGGIVRMRELGFGEMRMLSKSRDEFISAFAGTVESQPCRLLPTKDVKRATALSFAGLITYWLFGTERRFPRVQSRFPGLGSVVRESGFKSSMVFEEARVLTSDARMILSWIIDSSKGPSVAVNYCALGSCRFDPQENAWSLSLADKLTGASLTVRSRAVVNCAGVWADEINAGAGMTTPFRHVFAKGVAITFERHPDHDIPLLIEVPEYHDCHALIPWGPVSLFGPTESRVSGIREGFRPLTSEVDYLLGQANRHLSTEVRKSDVISVRCGIRPLAVRKEFTEGDDTSGLGRGYVVHADPLLPWVTVFGGKITSSLVVAKEVRAALANGGRSGTTGKHLNGHNPVNGNGHSSPDDAENFPGLESPVLSPRQCAETEMCWSLEDYLRRRTTISQWVPRCGLGRAGENFGWLETAARAFSDSDREAREAVRQYQRFVETEFDPLLG